MTDRSSSAIDNALSVLFLCTGNASRSVIAGSALSAERPDLSVSTAGTVVIDGLPLSIRTQGALADVGLSVIGHQSCQVTAESLRQAQVVVAMAPEHVRWIRKKHPEASSRTTTLINLVDQSRRQDGPAGTWLNSLALADHQLNGSEEIVDPGGGEVDGYIRVAHQIVGLIHQVAPRL